MPLMTKRYYSVDGEILGDSDAGDYMRDALGSVTATCNPDTGSVWNTYRYKPYGSDLSSSGGEKPDPKFRWVGTAGYRQTSISHSASYVRARHYGHEEGRWTTVDPLWPAEASYSYTHNSPASNIDPSGLKAVFPPGSACTGDPTKLDECCARLRRFLSPNGTFDQRTAERIAKCVSKAFPGSEPTSIALLKYLAAMCNEKNAPTVCVYCGTRGKQIPGLPAGCKLNCDSNSLTILPLPKASRPDIPIWNEKLCLRFDPPKSPCDEIRDFGCETVIVYCYDIGRASNPSYCSTFFHELIHGAGIRGAPNHNSGPVSADYVYALECCLCQAMNPPDRRNDVSDACQSACMFFFPKLEIK